MSEPSPARGPAVAAGPAPASVHGTRPGIAEEPLAPLLALTTAVQVFTTFVVAALPTLAPRAAATVGLEPHMVGYQVSIIYASAAVLSVYSGLVVRRLGACAASMIALATGIAGLVAISTGTLAGIVLGSLVLGAGYGLPGPAAAHLFMRYAPLGRRNLIFSVKQSGMPLGVALASILLPSLSERIGWQYALLASTLFLLMILVLLLSRRRRWDDDRSPMPVAATRAFAGVGAVLADPVLRVIGGIGLCYGGYQMCVIAFTVTMLVKEFGWTLIEAGMLAGAMQIGGVAGRIGFSLLADATRAGLAILCAVGVATGAFGMAVAWLGPEAPQALLVLLLLGLSSCMLAWNGIMLAETARISGRENVGLATGGILALCFLSVVVMPPLFAFGYQQVGSFSATLGVFSLVPFVGAAAALVGWHRDHGIRTA